MSVGMFRCGPASVKSIKEGNVFLGYDAKFIFAEVNGDRFDWLVEDRVDNARLISRAPGTSSVGWFISTKAVGSSARMDITGEYKYPEGETLYGISLKWDRLKILL